MKFRRTPETPRGEEADAAPTSGCLDHYANSGSENTRMSREEVADWMKDLRELLEREREARETKSEENP